MTTPKPLTREEWGPTKQLLTPMYAPGDPMHRICATIDAYFALADAIYSFGECPVEQAREIPPDQFLRTRAVSVREFNERIAALEARHAKIIESWKREEQLWVKAEARHEAELVEVADRVAQWVDLHHDIPKIIGDAIAAVKARREKCICKYGFGMNLSCPVHK